MGYTIWPDGVRGEVLRDVNTELRCQERLGRGEFIPDAASDVERLSVLAKEFGKVSWQVQEGVAGKPNLKGLREGLIQVAAVAVAWCEALGLEELRRSWK